mgnify:CR=1 FL=1
MSIDKYFLYYADGVPSDDLLIYSDETTQSVYRYLGENYGFGDQQAFLGYQGYVINSLDGSNNTYTSNATYNQVNQDINIEFTGLRPGEKLYEELLLNTEEMLPSHNPHIFIAQKEVLSPEHLLLIQSVLDRLNEPGFYDAMELIGLMKALIPEYKSNNSKFEVLDRV